MRQCISRCCAERVHRLGVMILPAVETSRSATADVPTAPRTEHATRVSNGELALLLLPEVDLVHLLVPVHQLQDGVKFGIGQVRARHLQRVALVF